MAGFPKYHELICDTYSPTFVPGNAPCSLPSTNATRSRLDAGGTRFRSTENGRTGNVNNIILECVITLHTNVPALLGSVITENLTFNYTDIQGVPQTPIYVIQVLDDTLGSPVVCTSGFDQLRAQLASNPIVTMPIDDSDNPNGAGWTNDGEGCFITAFGPTNMTGALIAPSDPGSVVPAIRTGPAYTLFHIAEAETEPTGGMTTVNLLSEWDGIQWIGHPSSLHAPATDVDGNIITPHPDCPNPPIAP